MLAAHLVPGYFAAVKTQSPWSGKKRAWLWLIALGSTIFPDFDVIYNVLFRGFFNHSVLWTHSLFPYVGLALVWWLLYRDGRHPYAQTLVGLATLGGLSHIFLDGLARGTTIFYPFSTEMVGILNMRVMQGGFWGYITDPVFLLEPLLLTLAGVHWALSSRLAPKLRMLTLVLLLNGLLIFVVTFLMLLPDMQRTVVLR